MRAELIISLVFLALSLVMVILAFSSKLIFLNRKFCKFYIAASLIYCSGTVLISVIIWINRALGLGFTLISEISILAIYFFDMIFISKTGTAVENLSRVARDDKNCGEKEIENQG